ncbi:hypothetical protein EDB83DRAFT_184987 [Lactarius deliciosus]|nr:hypothetical protein EDB83DRAFT_184987 [Lactarius deliciosus]
MRRCRMILWIIWKNISMRFKLEMARWGCLSLTMSAIGSADAYFNAHCSPSWEPPGLQLVSSALAPSSCDSEPRCSHRGRSRFSHSMSLRPRTIDDSLLPYTSAFSPLPHVSTGRGPPAPPRAPPRARKYRGF